MEDCGVDGWVDKTQDLNIKSQCSFIFKLIVHITLTMAFLHVSCPNNDNKVPNPDPHLHSTSFYAKYSQTEIGKISVLYF